MEKIDILKALKNNEIDLNYLVDLYSSGVINEDDFNEIKNKYVEWLEASREKDTELFFKDLCFNLDPIEKQGKVFTWGSDEANRKFTPIEATHYFLIVGGRGSGKTAFSFDMAVKNAKLGHSILYLSLEMNTNAIVTRIARNYAGINKEQWREKNKITEEQKRAYYKKKKEIVNQKNLILLGLGAGEDKSLDNIISIINAKAPDLVFVDNFNLMTDKGGTQIEKDENMSKRLMDFTNSERIPICVLHHLNKNGTVRGTMKIEDDCDALYICSRNTDPEEEDPEERAQFMVMEKKDREFGVEGVHTFYFRSGSFHDKFYKDKAGF